MHYFCRGLYFSVNQLLCIFIITIYETNCVYDVVTLGEVHANGSRRY